MNMRKYSLYAKGVLVGIIGGIIIMFFALRNACADRIPDETAAQCIMGEARGEGFRVLNYIFVRYTLQ